MLSHLIETSVHRRVATIFITAVIAAVGVRSYLRTPIEAFPDVTNPQVTVITQLPGAAPEEVERQITVPLERALNGTPGATTMRSESLFGLSLITLTFNDSADAFHSRLLVSQRLSGADLPEGVTPDLAPEATPLGEIYQFRVTSERHDLYDLRSELQWNITRVLRQVEGVADVVCFGGYLREVHVRLNPASLIAVGATPGDVVGAIKKANINVGGGFLRNGDQELTVRGIGYLENAEDIRGAVLVETNGVAVTVGDVATLVQAPTPRRGSVGYNLRPEVVEGFVLMRRGENPSLVLDAIHQKVDELNRSILPKGMKIEAFYDRTNLVSHTLSTVHQNLLHGFILVVAIVWLFLRSVGGSAIVALVIPLSLLVSFSGLYLMGLPANLISMGAIDFGILVDGAVVLVEHVLHSIRHEHPADRKGVLKLVIRSALDAGKPTFYAMLIIIAALVPVFTLESVEGRIFRPLALTYAFALVGALVFSITTVPALCALAFEPRHAAHQEPRWMVRLAGLYRRTLARLLGRCPFILAGGAVLLAAGGVALSRLGTEFLPELDEGDFVIFVEMPASIAADQGQELLVEVRRRLLQFPEVRETLSEHGRPEDGTDNEGVNMSETFVRLHPRDTWPRGLTKEGLIEEMRKSLTEIPGVRFNFSQPIKDNVEEAVSGVRGKVVLKLFGTDLAAMRATLEKARDALKDVAGVTDLDLYRDALVPQLQIRPRRRTIARYGLSMEDVQQTIGTALAGTVAAEFWEHERPVPVRVELAPAARDDVETIASLRLHTPCGADVALRDLADIAVASGVASINREGNSRFLALKFNVEGRDMGSVVKEAVATVAKKVEPPPGHYFVWGGEFENQARAVARLRLIVPVAILLVLGLLYAAMGSGRSALAIIATAPFALTGGAFALWIAGIPLSVSAIIGFIALLGQVSLMGVLVLGTAERLRRAGRPLLDALADGAAERLRPVLMASLLALFGLLPMAVATGVGSETQRPFALVVVGGMVTTLAVSLFFLPALYSLLTPRKFMTPEEADA